MWVAFIGLLTVFGMKMYSQATSMKGREIMKEKLNQALEKYSQNAGLRAIITAIPWVGGSLDVILSVEAQKISEKRILRLLKQFAFDIGKIKEENIDKDFMETEEFFDILRKVFELSIKTKDQEKIVLYSKILCNSLVENIVGKEKAEDYLSVLAELSTREVLLAKTIYDMQKDGLQNGENELQMAQRTGWNAISEKLSIHKEELIFLLKRIERTGLIYEITGIYYDYGGGVYVITYTFKEMMLFLGVK